MPEVWALEWQPQSPFKQEWKGWYGERINPKTGKPKPSSASKRRYTSITSRDCTVNVGLMGCTKIDNDPKLGSCVNCFVFRFPINAQWDGNHLEYHSFENSVKELRRWVQNEGNRWSQCRRAFLVDTSDLFHPDVPFSFIEKVHTDLIELPEFSDVVFRECTKRTARMHQFYLERKKGIPKNVWIGASVESTPFLSRLDHLAKIAALEKRHKIVTWCSTEPMLDDLTKSPQFGERLSALAKVGAQPAVWVIGGESGTGARALDAHGVANLIRAVESGKFGTAYAFYKQGSSAVSRQGGGGYLCPCGCGRYNHDQLALDKVQDAQDL